MYELMTEVSCSWCCCTGQ